MTIEEIKELIQVVTESGIAELELQRGENRVRIRRTFMTTQEVSTGVSGPVQYTISNPVPAQQVMPPPSPEPALPTDDPSLVLVKAPIVGTFYEASAPDAPAFVRVGDHVQPGKVLCIIESMKLMNEIEAEVSGTIVAKLVENGHPVEYGEALFTIKTT